MNHRLGASNYPLGYVASLDGARGLMTVGVMVAHIEYSLYPGSIIFMDTFFMMSAYLITALLRRDWEREGALRLGKFYLRRFLRLFPALAAMLLTFGVVVALFLDRKAAHGFEIASAALYFSNWTRAFGAEVPGYLGHTWSLSVEEQFYALWPLLLLFLLRRLGLSPRIAALLVAGAVLVAAWRFWLAQTGAPYYRLYNGFDTRADSLLLGCALAFLMRRPDSPFRQWAAARAGWALPLVSVLLFWLGGQMNFEDMNFYRYWQPACLFLSFVLCAGLIAGQGTLAHRFYELPPLVFMGKICYGLYLWHLPIFLFMRLHLGLSPVWEWTVGVGLTFTLAIASHFLIERPALALQRAGGQRLRQSGP